jgi:hypothetical protein
MKNIRALRDSQAEQMNPGQHIGTLLLNASNSHSYLVAQLTGYLEAAKADLADENDMMTMMINTMSESHRLT